MNDEQYPWDLILALEADKRRREDEFRRMKLENEHRVHELQRETRRLLQEQK